MSIEIPIDAVEWAADVALAAPAELPRQWPNRSSSRELSVDGIRWHYQRMGSGPRMLLVHGTAAATHSWRDLMPLLANDFDVLAIDLPGHGYTDRRPDGDMSLPALASALAGLLNTLDFAPNVAVGHSAGAAVALRMQLDGAMGPQTIVGLNAALLPFGGSMSRLIAPMAKMFAAAPMMAKMIARRAEDPASVRRILLGTGSEIDRRGIEIYQQLLRRESHVSAVLSMMASWRLDGFLEELREISCDLHLLSGQNDKAVSPEEANTVARTLPEVSVTRFPNCGHLAHEEQPDVVAKYIAEVSLPDDGDRDV